MWLKVAASAFCLCTQDAFVLSMWSVVFWQLGVQYTTSAPVQNGGIGPRAYKVISVCGYMRKAQAITCFY